ncbi:hypothetical protein HLB23_01610 [Nocardia uniformis]|uniref:Uncharacterized protein n=1 Tax=Nocardia uniformis TaxID=53432 RepID=A0A849C0R8_9NOCA|nr:hypothetical protein [Nocardia uniformis]NNH68589.1 hypothetical protein [Nocardia uniformis]
MRYEDGIDVLADHPVLLAIPAFVPAIAVVTVVVLIAVRDRCVEDDEGSERPTREDNR